MNRITRIFAELRSQGRKALMPFLTAGDPDVETTAALLPVLEQAGASICELGIPFSDPIADGPVIQAAMTRALDRGVRPGQVLDAVAGQRSRCSLGIVAMVSYSIIHRTGSQAFLKRCQTSGVDGLIVPDLPVEESDELRRRVADAGLVLSMLIAPTTPDARAAQIAQACSGFVYVLARAGITGERSELPADLPRRVERLRQVTDLPMAVGFGIATAQQVRQVVSVADAAIVGSAIVRRMAQHEGQGRDAVIEGVRSFVSELAGGLKLPATV
jgi:tryptophan synthase alpha chain